MAVKFLQRKKIHLMLENWLKISYFPKKLFAFQFAFELLNL